MTCCRYPGKFVELLGSWHILTAMSFFRCICLSGLFAVMLEVAPAGTLAQFRTILGEIEVELYDQQKPVTVANFKQLVQSGAYANTFFHRIVPGFIVQGGGYSCFDTNLNSNFGPNWFNLGSVTSFGPITNEFGVGSFFSNTNGTIAMAKLGGNPNSATCEWFFNLANNATNLDNQNGGFTVFGRVVRDASSLSPGTLLGFLNGRSYGNGMVNMGVWYPNDPIAANLFTTLPVRYAGSYQPWYSELLYVDISLLSVQITRSNQQQLISWNSVYGKTNFVEFTTTMPPVWQLLTSTNGTGNRITLTDPTATNSSRFYRVRVTY
jgi:cyclophilin family peptidyl-prolyl cis-trans isomerase